ncbi:serine/threonine-protein kinase/endoribonuclease IRE1-like [Rhodamnia argentea]|uniref:Serine/threonine-protein kinase/endoribonuclease IRE1-like n=1 Tax=Rhodamnia argentea TaxID=178133 RepID=A0A8B8NB50_9MYRT|nr:serine/threonine-protein kinase/endoribonuclease IRE1-like [Rhodamnia argentea]
MDFLSELYNYICTANQNCQKTIFLSELKGKKRLIFDSQSWDVRIDSHILPLLLPRDVHYNYENVVDLLQMVRNQWADKDKVSTAMQALPNPPSERLELYFTTKFPRLLLTTYDVTLKHLEGEQSFKRFFETNYR